jgi:hypothetical protein
VPPPAALRWQQCPEVSRRGREPPEVLIGALELPLERVEYLVESQPAILHVPSSRTDGLTRGVVTAAVCRHSSGLGGWLRLISLPSGPRRDLPRSGVLYHQLVVFDEGTRAQRSRLAPRREVEACATNKLFGLALCGARIRPQHRWPPVAAPSAERGLPRGSKEMCRTTKIRHLIRQVAYSP